MIKLQLFLGFVAFALWVYCLVSVIVTPAAAIRRLQKPIWVIVVLLFPLLGSLAWLVLGRPRGAARRRSAFEREAPAYPEYDRPGRAAAVDPAQDAAFLEGVRARAEEQRRRHEQARRERERAAEEERARLRKKPPVVDGAAEEG